MVKIALQIQCRLDNIAKLSPSGSEFRWCLKFVCYNCGGTTDKWNYVSLDETIPLERGSGVNNFVSKCKICLRENSLTIIEDSIKSVTDDDQGQFVTIVAFDCRGLEPVDFSAREGWVAQTIGGGKVFTVDLSEGEWEDYCDKIMAPVGIYDIQYKFFRMK